MNPSSTQPNTTTPNADQAKPQTGSGFGPIQTDAEKKALADKAKADASNVKA
jgi:hypothetical protein